MARALTDVVPLAIAVALSPLPILAVLLMLLSHDEIGNAGAFLAGWTTTVAAVTTAAVLAGVGLRTSDLPGWVTAAQVATGVVLVAAAAVVWRRRSVLRASRVLAAVDGITPPRAGALAVALVVLNAKVAVLSIAAGSVISDAGLPTGRTALALVVFVVIASTTIAVPVVVAMIAGERAEPTLRAWHGWFERNGTALVAVLAGIAGLLFVATAV